MISLLEDVNNDARLNFVDLIEWFCSCSKLAFFVSSSSLGLLSTVDSTEPFVELAALSTPLGKHREGSRESEGGRGGGRGKGEGGRGEKESGKEVN